MDTMIQRKGLTGFELKYLALSLMVLDHIHYFFGFTGRIPEWFSMLGRLSAPLFLFCVVEGLAHTHDRKRYFFRIYAISICMGLVQFAFYPLTFLVRGDGFFPQNAVFQDFTILLVILQGIDWCRAKRWGRGLAAILVPLALPYAVMACYLTVPGFNERFGLAVNLLHFSVLPLHSWIMDGGSFFIVEGILLYLFRGHRKAQAAVFFVADVLYYGVLGYLATPGATLLLMLTQYYEWFGAFAAGLMLLYNGERGHGSKRLFYWFYPAHVYVLYALSVLLYNAMH